MNEKELTAAKALYKEIGRDIDEIKNDYDRYDLTINVGRDKSTYAWYANETTNAAINIETLKITYDDDFISENFC